PPPSGPRPRGVLDLFIFRVLTVALHDNIVTQNVLPEGEAMSEFKQTVIAETAIDGQRPVLRMVDGLAADATTPAVEVSQLRKTYPGGVEAVKGVDFEVAP